MGEGWAASKEDFACKNCKLLSSNRWGQFLVQVAKASFYIPQRSLPYSTTFPILVKFFLKKVASKFKELLFKHNLVCKFFF